MYACKRRKFLFVSSLLFYANTINAHGSVDIVFYHQNQFYATLQINNSLASESKTG